MASQPEEKQQKKQDQPLWYAIHTYAGYENKVKTHLESRVISLQLKERIFRIIIPMEQHAEIKQGKRVMVQRKVYPCYVLVEMILDDESWHAVKNTPGVTNFVSSGLKPTPLQPEEIKGILNQIETPVQKPKTIVNFSIGESVRVIEGPFAEFIGTVRDVNHDKSNVTIMVSFFGRETPVVLDFLQVEKI